MDIERHLTLRMRWSRYSVDLQLHHHDLQHLLENRLLCCQSVPELSTIPLC